MTHHFKSRNYPSDRPVLPGGDIHSSNVDQTPKLCIMVILEEAHHRNNSLRSNQDLQLVARGELGLLDILGQALCHILPKLGEIFSDFRIELANSWPGL